LISKILQLTQARSQCGFEGVLTNQPCSLAKFIFNETAAVQGTIIQPYSSIVNKDSIQAIIHAAARLYVNELVCMHE